MKVLRVFNRQRARRIDGPLLRRIARCALEDLCATPDYEIAVHLVGADEMARLNETFLRHEGSTDVITFDYCAAGYPDGGASGDGTLRGEIFISIDDAARQAPRFGGSWQAETARYLVHGILHLQGEDDSRPGPRRAMKRRENNMAKELSRRFDLGRIERRGQRRNKRKQNARAVAG